MFRLKNIKHRNTNSALVLLFGNEFSRWSNKVIFHRCVWRIERYFVTDNVSKIEDWIVKNRFSSI